MIVFINGKYPEEQNASLPIWDAGFLYGEGIFTTLRVNKGLVFDLPGHFQRLKQQAQQLEIPFAYSQNDIQKIITRLVKSNELQPVSSRLRITLTRGGHSANSMPIIPVSNQQGTFLLTLSALPEGFDQNLSLGVKVITLGPQFARHCMPHLKSLNFLPSLMALRQAHHQNCTEAIMHNHQGIITEAAMSTVFIGRAGTLETPLCDGNILAGCTRKIILNLAEKKGLKFIEKDLFMADLMTADEVFLCNSIKQVVPVISIDAQVVGDGTPGPLTRQIRNLYQEEVNPS